MNQHLCFWCINVQGVPNKFPFKANAHLQLLLVNLSITCTWVLNGCFTPLNWTLILGFEWLTQQNRVIPLDRATIIYFIYDQFFGKWPAGSKVSPYIGAMSPKRPSRFHVSSAEKAFFVLLKDARVDTTLQKTRMPMVLTQHLTFAGPVQFLGGLPGQSGACVGFVTSFDTTPTNYVRTRFIGSFLLDTG